MTTVVFVLGMARSGTSAMTRVLSLAGAALPPGMIGAAKANPRGFWEPRQASFLNEKILRRHDSAAVDPTLRLHDEPADGRDIAEIKAYLSELPRSDLYVIKDLQMTCIAGMWFDAARAAGYDTGAVIAVRHPDEVIKSVTAMMPIVKPDLAAAVWLKNSLLAERYTRGLPRVFVEYSRLLQDWRGEVARMSAALGVHLEPDEEAINEFLAVDECHQQADGSACPEPFGTDWLTTTYDNLQRAARDDTWSQDELDRVFCDYRAGAQNLGAALDNYRRVTKAQRFVPRKLILELAALAHRRKGTWA
ncbi:sulfotransferase family protein [Mycobacterium sp. 94-17]|uniref:sulfotransferase family protein n=1 Tax=Mycobacterium sp. 94-17 TaxID=2986147 RepID=UPI002D1F24B9|nr:sulfotransferase family protein [Mycobacterium sp. 94-17]MEB4211819.1 sulfotransferase family protein [Mycobacterium sp. 94-17]